MEAQQDITKFLPWFIVNDVLDKHVYQCEECNPDFASHLEHQIREDAAADIDAERDAAKEHADRVSKAADEMLQTADENIHSAKESALAIVDQAKAEAEKFKAGSYQQGARILQEAYGKAKQIEDEANAKANRITEEAKVSLHKEAMAQALKQEKEALLSDQTDVHRELFASLAKSLQQSIFNAGFEQALDVERAKIKHDAEQTLMAKTFASHRPIPYRPPLGAPERILPPITIPRELSALFAEASSGSAASTSGTKKRKTTEQQNQ